MELAPFELRDPVSTLDKEIAEYIQEQTHKYCESVSWRILFGIPVSALMSIDYIDRIKVDDESINYSRNKWLKEKISILIVDYENLIPVAAIFHSSKANYQITKMISSLNALLVFRVNEDNYRSVLNSLFKCPAKNNNTNHAKIKLLNQVEKYTDLVLRGWIQPVNEFCQIMPQVGLSEVICLSDSNLQEIMQDELRYVYQKHTISSITEFKAWNNKPYGKEIQDLKLIAYGKQTSFDFVLVEKDLIITRSKNDAKDGVKQSIWWPSLAIEIDGPEHDKPHKKFNDFLKNELAKRAKLPLLRIRLVDAPDYYSHMQSVIGLKDPYIARPDIDFLRFMMSKKTQSYYQYSKNMKIDERWRAIAMRTKKLMQSGTGLGDALALAWREDTEFHFENDFDEQLSVEMDKHFDEEFEQEMEQKYIQKFNCQPNVELTVNENGEVSGRLGKVVLPALKAFCTEISESKMKELQLKFGKDWLFKTALGEDF